MLQLYLLLRLNRIRLFPSCSAVLCYHSGYLIFLDLVFSEIIFRVNATTFTGPCEHTTHALQMTALAQRCLWHLGNHIWGCGSIHLWPCAVASRVVLHSQKGLVLPFRVTSINSSCFIDELLQSLIVHIDLTHRLFLGAIRWPLEPMNEGLIVVFQLILHFLLFDCKFIWWVRCKMFPVNFLSIKAQLLNSLRQLNHSIFNEPLRDWRVRHYLVLRSTTAWLSPIRVIRGYLN